MVLIMFEKVLCVDCIFYGVISTIGRCKRNPPTTDGYPYTNMDDWCGEGKRKSSINNSISSPKGELLKG